MGVLGIHIHNLKDSDGKQASKGRSPFDEINVGDKKLSSLATTYDAPYSASTDVYDYIKRIFPGGWKKRFKTGDSYPSGQPGDRGTVRGGGGRLQSCRLRNGGSAPPSKPASSTAPSRGRGTGSPRMRG